MEQMKEQKKEDFSSMLMDEYFGSLKEIEEKQREFLQKLVLDYKRSNSYFMKLYQAIYNRKSQIIDPIRKLMVQLEDGRCTVKYKEASMEFTPRILLKVIGNLMELTENVLPLGSLVQLKKEYFAELLRKNNIDKLWVVITNRFLMTEEGSYYTYAGVVYPVANFNSQNVIQFTPGLIDKVIQKGYRDEQDEAYVYLMKSELIVEKKIRSAGFIYEEVNA